MVDVREAVTLFLPLVVSVIVFFFFSSSRRHTRLTCDWSSDVCSSDLAVLLHAHVLLRDDDRLALRLRLRLGDDRRGGDGDGEAAVREGDGRDAGRAADDDGPRSEERRVGKECRSRGWPCHDKK